ncbi:hypothetical protein BCS58_00825 [Enterovibrio norvegicus]|uniref:hypothetical protein n=1 Tax=Enterovibrio norvegicus TaxID=188144 RepID=UPI00389A86E5
MAGNENVIYINRSTFNGENGLEPDRYVDSPLDDFVLCRDCEGNPTAVYGGDSWDFNPYRLSARRISKIKFNNEFGTSNYDFESLLNDQIKYILYLIIYQSRSGRTGRTSASTLIQYFYTLRKIACFCVEQLDNSLASGITLNHVLANVSYMKAFLSRNSVTGNDKKTSSSILEILAKVEKNKLGFTACSKKHLQIERTEDQQTSVIPSRIYVAMMTLFDNKIDNLFPLKKRINGLIKAMEDRDYGLSIATQESRKQRLSYLRPTMEEAMVEHGLVDLLKSGELVNLSRAGFCMWLQEIQYVCKMAMHLYTGMRDQEAARVMYYCTSEHPITEGLRDEDNSIIDAGRMVSIVSTTTKFTGYKKEESWIAPDCVLKAIELARSIAEGLAFLYKIELKETLLFLSPSIVRSTKSKPVYINQQNTGEQGFFTKLTQSTEGAFDITEDDLSELKQTDLNRDFDNDGKFAVGNLWPITTHQYRRSLAFYASNSGFVSSDTVTTQFKHVARQLAQYYSRGSENLLPIFHEREAPNRQGGKSHIAYEFQLSAPIDAIEQLFADVFESEAQLLGGTGSYMEKMKVRIDSGEVNIHDSKKQTIAMARDGQISYRKTPLGGCTSHDVCKFYLMGEITECFTCTGSVIDPKKLVKLIESQKSALDKYEPESCEYELAEMELQKLEDYQRRKLKPGHLGHKG